jgi:hypothetical protein
VYRATFLVIVQSPYDVAPYQGFLHVGSIYILNIVKGKDIPVTDHGGPWGCEMLRLPHYLDKRLIDGGKVVSPTLTHFTPRFLYKVKVVPVLK